MGDRAEFSAVLGVVLALLTFATPAQATEGTVRDMSTAVRVNELATGSTGFVELVNDSTTSVDLTGWTVRSCTRGVATTLAVPPAGLSLDPGAFLLVVGDAFAGSDGSQLVVPRIDGTGAALWNAKGALVDAVDSVADSDCVLGRPAPVCASGSTARDPVGDDTFDNARDFACRSRTPGRPNN